MTIELPEKIQGLSLSVRIRRQAGDKDRSDDNR